MWYSTVPIVIEVIEGFSVFCVDNICYEGMFLILTS